MQLRSDSFLHRRAMPTRCALGRYRFQPADLAPDQRFELSDNRNPHLAWEDVPEGTRSFALICRDPDAPADRSLVNRLDTAVAIEVERSEFVHWVVADLPAELRSIDEGAAASGVTAGGKGAVELPGGGRQGRNDYTEWFADDSAMKGDYFGYDGPCPPWNDALIHMYEIVILALDVESLSLEDGFRASELRAAAEGHVIGEARLEGFYYLNPDARFR